MGRAPREEAEEGRTREAAAALRAAGNLRRPFPFYAARYRGTSEAALRIALKPPGPPQCWEARRNQRLPPAAAAAASRQPPQPAAPATGLAPSAPADTRRRVAVRGRRIRSAARPPCGGGRPAEAGAGRGGGGRRQRLAPPRSAVLPANWRSGRRARRPARPKFIPSRGRGCPRPALSAARGAGAGWERSACAEGSGGRWVAWGGGLGAGSGGEAEDACPSAREGGRRSPLRGRRDRGLFCCRTGTPAAEGRCRLSASGVWGPARGRPAGGARVSRSLRWGRAAPGGEGAAEAGGWLLSALGQWSVLLLALLASPLLRGRWRPRRGLVGGGGLASRAACFPGEPLAPGEAGGGYVLGSSGRLKRLNTRGSRKKRAFRNCQCFRRSHGGGLQRFWV